MDPQDKTRLSAYWMVVRATRIALIAGGVIAVLLILAWIF